MDGRKALVVGLGLFLGGAGCVSIPTAPGGVESRADAEKRVVAEGQAIQEGQSNSNNPKRTPKAETLVVSGYCAERQASNAQMPVQQQRELRDLARESYQKALKIDPNYKDAHLPLARLYIAIGDEDRALATYQKALEKFPREAALHYDLGMYHCNKRKDFPKAIEYLTKAHQLEPENREIATKLGLTLARTGKSDEAVACLSPCLGRAEANFTVARMMDHIGQPEASKRH